MKRNLLLMLIFVLLLASCQTEGLVEISKNHEKSISEDIEWKFVKELTLRNGENVAFLKVCSNDEVSLNSYLNGIDIELIVYTLEQVEQSSFAVNDKKNAQANIEHFETREPSVVVVHEGNNFQPDVVSSKITFKPKPLKSYGPLPIAAHESWTKFIGIVTEDDGGLDLMVTFFHKQHWYSSWTQIQINSITPRPGYSQNYWNFDTYKNRMQIYRHWDDTVYPTYSIYTVVQDFQRTGNNCLMGSYDGANCYVGSAPWGTTAFIYDKKFYYSPVNGNQCPMPGSNYDGANCFVASIVDYADAFIYNNNWYVHSYWTSELFGKVE